MNFDRRKKGPPAIPQRFLALAPLGHAVAHSIANLLLRNVATPSRLTDALTAHGYAVSPTAAPAVIKATCDDCTIVIEATSDKAVVMTGPGFELKTFNDGEYVLYGDSLKPPV